MGVVGFTFFCIECFLDDEANRPIVTTHQYIHRNTQLCSKEVFLNVSVLAQPVVQTYYGSSNTNYITPDVTIEYEDPDAVCNQTNYY